MKKNPGRPKTLKAKEVKKPVPIRLSAVELKVLKAAAKDQPLTTWMRETLLTAAGYKEHAKAGIAAMVDEATGFSPPGRGTQPKAPPASLDRLRSAPVPPIA